MATTLFNFKRRTTFVLSALLFFVVFAFGATDPWAFPVVAGGVLALSAFWVLRMLRHPYGVALSWFYLPLALIPAAAALQLLAGRTASRYHTLGALAWWIVYFVFFVLLVNVVGDVSLRRTMQRRLAYLGGAVSAAAILQWMASPRAAYGFRTAPGASIFGPFADADNFAFLIELLFPGALLLAFRDSRSRLSLLLCCALMIGGIALSGSTLGQAAVAGEFFVALLVAMYLAARSLSRRVWGKQAFLTVVGAVAVALAFFIGFGADEIRARLGLGLDPLEAPGVFVLTRADVLGTSWDLIQQRPGLGHGLGAFGAAFAAATDRRDGFHWEHGYNDPVELTVELGAAGAIAQLLMLTLLVASRRDPRAWVSCVLPLAVLWLHSWTRSPLRTPAVVLTALALLALLPRGDKRAAADRQAET